MKSEGDFEIFSAEIVVNIATFLNLTSVVHWAQTSSYFQKILFALFFKAEILKLVIERGHTLTDFKVITQGLNNTEDIKFLYKLLQSKPYSEFSPEQLNTLIKDIHERLQIEPEKFTSNHRLTDGQIKKYNPILLAELAHCYLQQQNQPSTIHANLSLYAVMACDYQNLYPIKYWIWPKDYYYLKYPTWPKDFCYPIGSIALLHYSLFNKIFSSYMAYELALNRLQEVLQKVPPATHIDIMQGLKQLHNKYFDDARLELLNIFTLSANTRSKLLNTESLNELAILANNFDLDVFDATQLENQSVLDFLITLGAQIPFLRKSYKMPIFIKKTDQAISIRLDQLQTFKAEDVIEGLRYLQKNIFWLNIIFKHDWNRYFALFNLSLTTKKGLAIVYLTEIKNVNLLQAFIYYSLTSGKLSKNKLRQLIETDFFNLANQSDVCIDNTLAQFSSKTKFIEIPAIVERCNPTEPQSMQTDQNSYTPLITTGWFTPQKITGKRKQPEPAENETQAKDDFSPLQ